MIGDGDENDPRGLDTAERIEAAYSDWDFIEDCLAAAELAAILDGCDIGTP